MKKIIFFSLLLASAVTLASKPILVTETTISLDFEGVYESFFSFQEGDEIIFNMEMVKGKHIKDIEITELSGNTIFTDFKSKGIVEKKIAIRNKGIYKFRLYSSSITRRVCKIKIQRIPVDDSQRDFNTNWKWKTLRDTTYVKYEEDSLTGFMKVPYTETVKELMKESLEEINVFEKTETVHSILGKNNNNSFLIINLPKTINNDLKVEKILAWSYWIGVGQDGQNAYRSFLENATDLMGKSADAYFGSPLASLAIGKLAKIAIPQNGENVRYFFMPNYEDVQLFLNGQEFQIFDKGNGPASIGRNDYITSGRFFLGLNNDNNVQALDVKILIIAVKEIKEYEFVEYNREREEPQYITLLKNRMVIKEDRVRIPVE